MRPIFGFILLRALVLLLQPNGPRAADIGQIPLPLTRIEPGRSDEQRIVTHAVESEYQRDQTEIRVLLPDSMVKERRYRVLYILPVEAGSGTRYGDGLLEVKRLNLHNRYTLICVAPTFSHLPWYADHPSDARIRQESYFLKVVLPFVEHKYPVLAEPNGRLLLGFSKSGWGAYSLLLRHPDLFGRAAAWDAPLAMEAPSRFGMGEIFGSEQNFGKYRITALLEDAAGRLRKEKRLAVLGHGGFREMHVAVHDLMVRHQIAHEYQDGPPRKHAWDSGWVAEAVRFLADGSLTLP